MLQSELILFYGIGKILEGFFWYPSRYCFKYFFVIGNGGKKTIRRLNNPVRHGSQNVYLFHVK